MTNSHDLLLIKSSKYLLFGVYFSLHQRNNVCKYERQRKPIVRDTNRFVFFNKQPFRKGVNLKRLNNFFFSTALTNIV